jgi:hypothetical protein
MNLEQGKARLKAYYSRKENHSWWARLFHNNKDITIEISRVLQSWEKAANLSLPEKIEFPELTINRNGVARKGQAIEWQKFATTAIVTYRIQVNEAEFKYENYFAGCLTNGEILEFKLGDISQYSNLLGHFIELYKTAA